MKALPGQPLPSSPWFQRRRWVTLGVALALFAVVFGLRLQRGDDTGEVITLLFVLPIALLAVAFGLRGGITSGLFGVALVAVWVQSEHIQLTPMGWATRLVPLLLLGVLLGRAVDQLHHGEVERRALQAAALLHREAIEINDTLVQGMAVAKWSLESGRHEVGLNTLNDTLDLGHRLVSDLIREADRRADDNPRPAPPQR